MSSAPLTFTPLYKTRVWGGRKLAGTYGRELPDRQPYGESWEMVDRADDQSVVASGPLAGKTLQELWSEHREEIFGSGLPDSERFPILIKILDCQDDLSIQVHPPADLAPLLGGEPKTEMWYLADAEDHAALYIGLKKGVTRAAFEQAVKDGTVAEVVHRIEPKAGESIFIPSGRLHAIGGGNLIFEIQQNSDTTYRVFDWNRKGLDGQPRELHVKESLASIDFGDFEPAMDEPTGETLATCAYFQTDRRELVQGENVENPDAETFSIVAIVSGELQSETTTHKAGDFLLLPQGASPVRAKCNTVLLQITLPRP
jgi:mannose-6-phosphate isomerase